MKHTGERGVGPPQVGDALDESRVLCVRVPRSRCCRVAGGVKIPQAPIG